MEYFYKYNHIYGKASRYNHKSPNKYKELIKEVDTVTNKLIEQPLKKLLLLNNKDEFISY